MFDGCFKQAFGYFEVFFITVVMGVVEINYTEKIHDIRHIFNRNGFGRIVFGELVDYLFQQITFLDFSRRINRVQRADDRSVNQV